MTGRAAMALLLVSATATVAHAQDYGSGPPTPVAAVRRACDAAGGLDAFMKLGILQINVVTDELTQDGQTHSSRRGYFVVPPGPTPARLELVDQKVVAGDDGTGGWALANAKPDQRPSTTYMIKRMATTFMFPTLLPFSLNWDGVSVSDVAAAKIGERPVWRLKVKMSRSFFHTPQMATDWTVDLDRETYVVVRAEAPATDLGQGIRADGMRYSWSDPVKLKSLWLRGTQRIVGLDENGYEKAHSQISKFTFTQVGPENAQKLFANPIPVDLRPKNPMPPDVKPGG